MDYIVYIKVDILDNNDDLYYRLSFDNPYTVQNLILEFTKIIKCHGEECTLKEVEIAIGDYSAKHATDIFRVSSNTETNPTNVLDYNILNFIMETTTNLAIRFRDEALTKLSNKKSKKSKYYRVRTGKETADKMSRYLSNVICVVEE